MTRLTLRDWQVINSALAYYEVEGAEAAGLEGDELDEEYTAMVAARVKVHQRLKGRYER